METDQPCLDIKDDGRTRVMNCNDGDGDGGGGGDRISALPDDILLDIFQWLDLRTAVRASAVARRWRRLPCMLPDLDMDIATLVRHRRWWFSVDSVMATYTKSVMSFLLPTRHRTSLRLAFYLVEVDPCLRSIGDAVTATTTDRLELTLRTAYGVEFGEYDRRLASFMAAFPAAFARLTNITLHEFVFATSSEITGLLDACHGLELLSLTKCRCLDSVVEKFEIDAPSSSLLALELHGCFFHGVELTRLPKLERLLCDDLTMVHSMRFSCVPLLRAINLSAQHLQCYIDNPALLSPAFKNLTDVSLCYMHILDMAWIISVLHAAPFLSSLSIKLTHRCVTHEGPNKFILAGERPKFQHHNLISLEIKSYGISKDLDVMHYIRLIRTHAVCLKRIHLLEQCEYSGCDGVTCLCQVEDERKKIVRDILNLGFSTSVEITIEPKHSKRKIMEQVTSVC